MSKSDIVNNLSSFLCYLQTQVDTVCGSTTRSKDFLLLSSSIGKSSDNVEITVSTTSALPNLYQSSIPSGMIVYIEDIDIPVISSNESWYTFDGILVRSDAPVRTLYTWGDGFFGELGDGTVLDRCSPGTVAGGGTTWCWVSSGYKNHFAIKTDGTLWSWGSNNAGQLGDGTTVSRSSPGTVAGGGTTWCQVSGGSSHTAAIKTDGTLWTWGCNQYGGLGDGTTVNRSSPGTVVNCGTTWCQISSGFLFTSAIKTDGTLWTWGSNSSFGPLGEGTTTPRCSPGTTAGGGTNWCNVSVSIHSTAIKTDGTLWTWGRNDSNQLGDGSTNPRSSPGTISGGGTTWCQVSSSFHTAAIKTDGTLWTWGFNQCGRLGNGLTLDRCSPGTVAGAGTNWCQVFTGRCNSVAVKNDGTLWTWGRNDNGRLGDGTTVDRSSPGTVAGGGTTWYVSSSGQYNVSGITVT